MNGGRAGVLRGAPACLSVRRGERREAIERQALRRRRRAAQLAATEGTPTSPSPHRAARFAAYTTRKRPVPRHTQTQRHSSSASRLPGHSARRHPASSEATCSSARPVRWRPRLRPFILPPTRCASARLRSRRTVLLHSQPAVTRSDARIPGPLQVLARCVAREETRIALRARP